VKENELDQAETGEPPTAMVSWHTLALVLALLLVGGSVWWFLQPPTADALYKRIIAKTADESSDAILQAENDIEDFLNRYPEDARTRQLREYAREIELHRLERRFDLRLRGLASTAGLSHVEKLYLEAINLLRFDPAGGMAKLQAIVDLYNQSDDVAGPTAQCCALAQRRISQIHERIAKQTKAQLTQLGEHLNAADAEQTSDPRQAAATYRAVIELYGDKPWAADIVQRATTALKKLETKKASSQ
jgi:hypothetical protein